MNLQNLHNLHHPKNNYVDKLNIVQVNTSNADWDTKQTELLTTIVNEDADICIVSESNSELNKPDKMAKRNSAFKNYKIEDKKVNNQNKSRISIIIKKEISSTRCTELEDINNSTIIKMSIRNTLTTSELDSIF